MLTMALTDWERDRMAASMASIRCVCVVTMDTPCPMWAVLGGR
jgi:hypothetical protein